MIIIMMLIRVLTVNNNVLMRLICVKNENRRGVCLSHKHPFVSERGMDGFPCSIHVRHIEKDQNKYTKRMEWPTNFPTIQ